MKINKQFGLIKALPEELKAKSNPEDGIWVWITSEIVDSDGDIVRVSGINTSKYHNPPNTHMKCLAQHLKKLEDGTAPVIGIITEFKKTINSVNGRVVPAMAAYVEWLKKSVPVVDADGKQVVIDGVPQERLEMLPLAKHYYEMTTAKPHPGIDSVSVGIDEVEYKALEGGRYDITGCSLYEVSMVTVPSNYSATVIKELKDRFGDQLDTSEIKEVEPEPTPEVKEDKPDYTAQFSAYDSQIKELMTRLEVMESRMVIMEDSKVKEPEVAPDTIKGLSDLSESIRLLKSKL